MRKFKLIKKLNEVKFIGEAGRFINKMKDEGRLDDLAQELKYTFILGVEFDELKEFLTNNQSEILKGLNKDSYKLQKIHENEGYPVPSKVKIFVNFDATEMESKAFDVVSSIKEDGKFEKFLDILGNKFPKGATLKEVEDFIMLQDEYLFIDLEMEY